ncbi:MAG: hypothetical protein ACE5IM_14710 [Nitrospinota bacterium]
MSLDALVTVGMAGFLATYAHMMVALWAHRFGLARLDFARGMSRLSFGEAFEGNPPYWMGFAAVLLNGILFAFVYGTAAGAYLPGAPLVRGLIWGGVLLIVSQCVFNPIVARNGFFTRKLHPRAWQTAVLVHGVYGLVLGWLCPIL